ncbi:TPA: baseplate J/gp47 family protein [Escherichia coli]|nr:baseplate J/gp47 family protein [Escherichia coli]HEL7988058.1 baseplate J/gp47 family protein [Escherichia coli]HEL8068290.1 baseplate J/gp47 family protein [Escherichia coli]
MPFERPVLSELREKSRSYVTGQLDEAGTLLRFSTLGILADVTAGMAHLHYGYLDWIALQCTPATATGEYLAAWGALKGIIRKAAVAATCDEVQFTGTPGSTVSAGAVLNRADGYQYTLDAAVNIDSDGSGSGSITAVLPDPTDDSSGGGDDGNAGAGTTLTPDVTWSGIDSTVTMISAASGGSDIEEEETYRQRVLYAYQNPPQGGASADYVQWALEVSGVTRAWCVSRALGPGTVGIYIMTDDDSEDNSAGFPDGTDGVASDEDWTFRKATGVQLTVADYVRKYQPVTAVVYVMSPVARRIDFDIQGLSDATASLKASVESAISEVLYSVDALDGSGVINLSDLYYAIADVEGTDGFILVSPDSNITLSQGELPVTGSITWAT